MLKFLENSVDVFMEQRKAYLIYFLSKYHLSTYLKSDSKKEIEPCLNKYLTLVYYKIFSNSEQWIACL